MRDKVIVARYAEAFFAFTKVRMSPRAALSDLKNIRDIVRDTPEFVDLLERPEVNLAEKHALIDKVLEGSVSSEARDFLKLLVDKRRIGYLLDIIEYSRLKYSHVGEEAVIKTAFPFDGALLKKMESALEKKFGRTFKFQYELDKGLLGGVEVTIGNTVIDGSVKRRLDELKQELSTAQLN